MIYLSFRLPVVTLGLLGLLLIISSCVRWGLVAGAISSTYASVMLLLSYNLHGGIAMNIAVSISTFYLTGLLLGMSIDTIRRQNRHLAESEVRYRRMFEDSQDAMMTMAPPSWRITAGNKAVFDLFGVADEKEFTSLTLNDISPQKQLEDISSNVKAREMIKTALLEGSSYFEWIFKKHDGKVFPATVLLTSIELSGEPLLLATIRDITLKKEADEKIRFIIQHDRLTGLHNRYYLEEKMKDMDTDGQLPFSIIMADLNGLKLLNDSYGHDKGDKMLEIFANILKNTCRSKDFIARWGGDEFVILLPGTETEEAWSLGKVIHKKCLTCDVESIPLSISIGVSSKNDGVKPLIQTLREAEDNMYKQKLTESRSTKSALLQALLNILAEKSYETEMHTRRMQQIAQKIGFRLKLPDAEMSRLNLLITLHDIGKVNISEEILTKKSSLTTEEWETIKKHPEIGFRIARSTEEFSHVAEDILSHHERWDGSGYPRGLSGKEIPLLARITAIADAFEVMSNGRPYKAAMTTSDILAEFEKCSGSHFDPELVNTFFEIFYPE